MTLARIPTRLHAIADVLDAKGSAPSGQANTAEGRFVCEDPRPARWVRRKAIWLHGFWVWDWADLRIPLGIVDPATRTICLAQPAVPTTSARASGSTPKTCSRSWTARRVVPGPRRGILYFWPPAPLATGEVVVSVVRDLFRLNDVSHVTFRGCCRSRPRHRGRRPRRGQRAVVGCTIRNMGNWARQAFGGTEHGVAGCDIYQTGQGGIPLDGGDRKTLTPAGHYADNNHIHHTARWDPVYQPGSRLRRGQPRHPQPDSRRPARGHRLQRQRPAHRVQRDPQRGLRVQRRRGHLHLAARETWSMRGTISATTTCTTSTASRAGAAWACTWMTSSRPPISPATSSTRWPPPILIGGGRDNLMTNNIFIHCGRALSIDARGLGWAKSVGISPPRNSSTSSTRTAVVRALPGAAQHSRGRALAPKGNVMARNISWGGKWGWTNPRPNPTSPSRTT